MCVRERERERDREREREREREKERTTHSVFIVDKVGESLPFWMRQT